LAGSIGRSGCRRHELVQPGAVVVAVGDRTGLLCYSETEHGSRPAQPAVGPVHLPPEANRVNSTTSLSIIPQAATMPNRNGKTYFITGAGSGLGEATARLLHSEGANVALADKNFDAVEEMAAELGPRALPLDCDVTSRDSVGAAVAGAVTKYGTLNGCVNCAGIGSAVTTVSRKLEPMDPKWWDFVMGINANGTFYGSSHCAAAMARLPASQNGQRGVIINVASVAGIEGQKGQVPYSASKGAVIGMTLPMARDLARFGIRVMTIAPGIMETPLMLAASEKVKKGLLTQVVTPKRFGTPEEFAQLCATIIDNEYLNGEVIRLDGGIRFANL